MSLQNTGILDLSGLQRTLLFRAKLAAQTSPLMKYVAKELKVIYLEHFRMLESRGNQHGFPARHFWNREVARYTTTTSDNTTATVQVASSAYMHKISGGRIMPKNGKALAIPVSSRAYAAGAPRVCGLPLIFIPDLNKKIIGFLVEHEVMAVKVGQRGKQKGVHRVDNAKTLGTIHYLLVPYVDQAPMPDAKPPASTRNTRVGTVIRQWIDGIMR